MEIWRETRESRMGSKAWMVMWFAAAAACGGGGTSNHGSDGQSGDGDAHPSTGDGDGAAGTNSHLADGVVGKACTHDSDTCGSSGTCATALTGGALGALSQPLPADQGYCTSQCTKDEQCGQGGTCFGSIIGIPGECRRKCTESSDCSSGQECAKLNTGADTADAGVSFGGTLASTCQPLPKPDKLGAHQTGKSCTKDDDCGDGVCAEANSPLGGYCSGLCIKDSDCGTGGVCIPGTYGSSGSCRERCSVDHDCQNDAHGWGCGTVGDTQVCVRKADPLPDGVVGKACTPDTAATDCGPGSCRQIGYSGEHYPGGYCVGSCTSNADCGATGVCINATTCLLHCDDVSDCRDGYDCVPHPQDQGDAGTICYPKPEEATDAG
jgi:hypothetical protein